MTHTCIRPDCGNQYEDQDPDPYYCPSCKRMRNEVAKEIDARLKNRVSTRQAPSIEQQLATMPTIPGTNIKLIQ